MFVFTDCPANSILFENRCFWKTSFETSFCKSLKECSMEGGRLAVVDSQGKQEAIVEKFMSTSGDLLVYCIMSFVIIALQCRKRGVYVCVCMCVCVCVCVWDCTGLGWKISDG